MRYLKLPPAGAAGASQDSPLQWRRLRPIFGAWVAIALTVCAIMLPTALRPMMMIHDSFWIDYVWASQFTALLHEGILYPRWLPWSHDGLGSPVFYYYPPLAFYVTGVFGLAGLSTYGSIIAAFALAYFASGIGCYYWLKDRTPHPLLGATFFVVGPYHCLDFYVRGALAESVAFAFLPLLAIGLRRIAEGRSWTFAALAYCGMILSHLPLALLTSCFFIAPYAAFHRRHWVGFGCACLVGIGLAAIYLIPAFGLEPFRDVSRLRSTRFLRPTFWSLYSANWHVLAVVAAHFTIAILAVPALIFAIASRNRWAFYALAMLAIAAGLIPGLWSLPLLRDVQFSYRVLPLAELGLAYAFASRSSLSFGARSATMALPLVWTAISTQYQPPVPDPYAPHRDAVQQRYVDVSEYLPPGAQLEFPTHWVDHPKRGRIPPPIVEGWVVRPVFYFPAWSCGRPEPKTKLLMHRPGCLPKIQMTHFEKLGALISLVALLALIMRGAIGKKLEDYLIAVWRWLKPVLGGRLAGPASG